VGEDKLGPRAPRSLLAAAPRPEKRGERYEGGGSSGNFEERQSTDRRI
jgi:hypothetical protein